MHSKQPTFRTSFTSKAGSIACRLSRFSCVRLCETPWIIAHQVPLSVGFSRQKYRSGLPCPPPGDLSNLGTEPMTLMSPALAGRFLTTSTTWETQQGWLLSPFFHLGKLRLRGAKETVQVDKYGQGWRCQVLSSFLLPASQRHLTKDPF